MGKIAPAPILSKATYRIGEAAALAGVEPYVLRYWEREFPALRPTKTPSGQRLYRRADVETILRIKSLLYEQGFTIAGARKALASAVAPPATKAGVASAPAFARPLRPARGRARRELEAVRGELAGLLTLLSRD
jgi:DNA-binding transcriptional MerR regulator